MAHQHQFDPIHADVDEEITSLRSQVRRLRNRPHQKGGYREFYAKITIPLTPKIVNDIHKRGGTNLGTSRDSHNNSKIADNIQDRGFN